jgi:Rrf2 family protein
MKSNSQLSDLLHVLLHMADSQAPATSETLAATLRTNPVVLRRLMAGLRRAGFVTSAKGHGGGWMLSCPLAQISLRDIHDALGSPSLLAVGHRREQPDCLIEQAVNAALDQAYQQAEALLRERLGAITLAALAKDVHHRRPAGACFNPERSHDT